MDGLKKRVKDSLQLRLFLWLSLTILSVALTAGLFSFYSAFSEVHELQDDVLRQVAALFNQQHFTEPQYGDSDYDAGRDPESRVFVQLLTSTTPTASARDSVAPSLALPQSLHEGLQTVQVNHETYRVLIKTLKSGQRLAVAQETAVRDEIARDGALRTLMPFLILVPILLLVVIEVVRKIVKPIADLSHDIDQRGEQELHPIASEQVPVEIRPFVDAINRLLKRVELSMNAQRRFVANAAHELRSPLTALSLQAERLADTDMSSRAHERLTTLRQGIERGRTLLDQLLTLARAQSSTSRANDKVSIQQVYRRVLEDLMPLAEKKDIDIGVTSDEDARVLGSEIDLITLVKNLVDNAVRYTPAGGRVDLSIVTTPDGIILAVEDTGPGIAASERERVFDPFYRVLGSNEVGSGLGLSIVQSIAARMGATITLNHTNEASESGLRVMVTFPVAAIRTE